MLRYYCTRGIRLCTDSRQCLQVGAYDTFMNLQIAILMVVQAALCVFGAAMATTWRDNDGVQRYYIGADQDIQGNYENSVVFGIVSLLTYWIILSYMVPISLFVTMEIVKFWQGFMFINMDPYMVDPETTEGARCRNSNLMEDLGKVGLSSPPTQTRNRLCLDSTEIWYIWYMFCRHIPALADRVCV